MLCSLVRSLLIIDQIEQELFVVVVVVEFYSAFELLLQVVFVVHKMPQAHFDATVESPHLDVLVDLGNPFLNRVFDGFVKVGGVSNIMFLLVLVLILVPHSFRPLHSFFLKKISCSCFSAMLDTTPGPALKQS
jgi:hypothetical protein